MSQLLDGFCIAARDCLAQAFHMPGQLLQKEAQDISKKFPVTAE
jgi:hypothetical protein